MKIKHGMILAAGFGKRMQPLTLKIPKPLLEIEGVTLLERALNLLISNGVEEVSINIHHLSHQIREYLSKAKHKANIEISSEEDLLLDTGGGAEKATKNFKKNPFFIINPDTLWSDKYYKEVQFLEKVYIENKKPCLLLVKKDLSLDKSFKGDFNLNGKLVSKDANNKYIYTGLQIITRDYLNLINKKVFSMNEVWSKLINEKNLYGVESNQKFYHLNSLEMYEKISKINKV